MYTWKQEANGWVGHAAQTSDEAGDPVSLGWHEVPLPPGWQGWLFRLTHSCQPWSVGVHGWIAPMEVTERCVCGGWREGRTVDLVHRWAGPNSPEGLLYRHDTGWRERNSRYRGTATFRYPTYQPIPEES